MRNLGTYDQKGQQREEKKKYIKLIIMRGWIRKDKKLCLEQHRIVLKSKSHSFR